MTREEFWATFAELSQELSCRKLGQILGMSSSTTARWKSRRGSPPRGMRQFVIDELKKRKAKVDRVTRPEVFEAMGLDEGLEPRGREGNG